MKCLKKNSTSENQEHKIIEDLATILRGENGELVATGKTKLVLTIASLSCLNRQFCNAIQDSVLSDEIVLLDSTSSSYSHHDNVHFLQQYMKRVMTLKIVPGSGSVQGCVDLTHFLGLKYLEIERIPIHLFKGLQYLRSRLRIISCHRCVGSLRDLFSICGGDHAVPFPWSDLLAVRLSNNDIHDLDDSLKLLPLVVSLDLSHNNICHAEEIEYLTKLEHLNLSYNSFHLFPSQMRNCINLKILHLKNNCLETLIGLERLVFLQEVDLSYNCLIDHCALKPFAELENLKLINLDGNPISYHREHRLFTSQHLNQKAIQANITLDGQKLTTVELNRLIAFSCIYCYGEICLNSINDSYADRRTISKNKAIDESGSVNSICDLQSSGEFGGSESVSKIVPKRKARAVREAQINDEISSRENQAVYAPFNLVQPSEVISNEHLQTKHEIESCRKQHGKEWLIIGTRLSVLSNSCQEREPKVAQQENQEEDLQFEDQHKHLNARLGRVSQVSDDVIVLNEEPEEPPSSFEPYNTPDLKILNDRSIPSQFNKCIGDETSDDDDGADDCSQPFIVHMEKPGSLEPVILLLIMKDNELREKDFVTGRTIERLDLRGVQSFETLPSKKTLVDGVECELPRLKITFNHVRRDRRQRIYSMEDEQSYKEFCDLMKAIADENTFKEVTVGALQCLKCHSVFSKNVVTRILQNVNQQDDINILSTSSEVPKGSLQGGNVCPNCYSQMIIEVDDLHSNLLKLDAAQMLPLNQSTPVFLPHSGSKEKLSSSFKNSFLQKLTDYLPSQTSFTSSSLTNSTSEYKTAISSNNVSIASRNDCCTNFAVEVEVHHSPKLSLVNMQPESVGDLKRWESDITICSNPSQSSIIVLPRQNSDLNLNAMLENNDTNRLSVIPEALQLSSACVNSPQLRKLNSGSSGSLTGSSSTTVENRTRCSTTQLLAQSPESFLSALSGSYNVAPSHEAKDSEKITFGIHSDVYQRFDCFSGKKKYPLLWSCRNSDLAFSFNDFGRLDHRLKLHLDMYVLDDNEEVIALLRAGIKPYLKDEEYPGCLVMCHSKVYIMKITPETEFSQNWLVKVASFPTDTLAYLIIHLGGQAFQLEFAQGANPDCFTFLLRDDDHCNSFVSFVMEKIKNGAFELEQSSFIADLDSEETLQVIREQLFTWKNGKDQLPNSSVRFTADEESDDDHVYFYLMCYWLTLGNETSFRPISIVVTKTDVFIFSENLLWPLPHLISPSSDLLNQPQLIPQLKERIQDLISVHKLENRSFEMVLKFLDENSGEEMDIRIATETERSLNLLIQALKDPWERLFDIELQIHER